MIGAGEGAERAKGGNVGSVRSHDCDQAMSTKPATHAPAHAAAPSQSRRQPATEPAEPRQQEGHSQQQHPSRRCQRACGCRHGSP
jgi:hypothetical protein